ncbi:MAG: serine protease [Xenococcus sp. (in: cyanobacteria)]
MKAYNNLIGALFKQGKSEVALREYLNSLEIKTDDENNFNAKYYELREQERQFFIQRKLRLLEIDKPIFLTNQANKTSDNNRPSVDILRSTARIIAEVPSGDISIGAGWVVKKSSNTTWIVTNRHVISDSKTNIPSKKIKVEFFSELPYEERSHYAANIVKSTEADDYKLDLAVLKVTGIPNNVQSLEIFSGKFKHYANVQTIGHSFIRENSWIISQGEVQDYNINNLKFSINGIFSKGNSGAPVIDINDQIIGMMVGMRTNEDIAVATDQINFNINVNQPFTAGVGIAYRIDIVIEKLREWGIIE